MKSVLKKINVLESVAHITVEFDPKKDVHNELMALGILLGGYNQYGRRIDIDKYNEIKERFNSCIYEIERRLE